MKADERTNPLISSARTSFYQDTLGMLKGTIFEKDVQILLSLNLEGVPEYVLLLNNREVFSTDLLQKA